MNKISTTKVVKLQILKRLVRKILIIILVVFSFLTIFINKSDNIIIDKLNGLVLDITSPLIKIISSSIYTTYNFIAYVSNFNKNVKQKETLKLEILELKEQINKYKRFKAENDNLKNLVNYTSNDKYNFISTRVIGYSGSSFSHSFILDAGEDVGISKYDGVLVDGYLVGQIVSVGNKFSRLMLITDPISKIPVQVERTGTRAFLEGTGAKYPKVIYFENKEPVQIGDVVISSGMGEGIPVGIPIGIIANISENQEVILQPFVDNSNIEYVKVIKILSSQEFKKFITNKI